MDAYHCFYNYLWLILFRHRALHQLSWNSIKCLLNIHKHTYNFLSLSLYSSCILLTTNNASVIFLLGIKPNCIYQHLPNSGVLFFSTLSTIFIVCSNNLTPLYALQHLTYSFPLKIGTNVCLYLVFFSIQLMSMFHHHANPCFSTLRYHFCTYFRESNCLC